MLTALGWILIVFPGILFVGQIISTISFPLAQRLGLQEDPAKADKLVQRAERYVAYWDLITLGWMPLTGVLMVLGHDRWSLVGLFAAAIYLDASGREAAKILSFSHEGLALGSPQQHRFFRATYLIMAALGLVVAVLAVRDLLVQDG